MSTTTAEWLLEISGLTVGTPGAEDPTDRGRALATQVCRAAAAHLAVSPCGVRDDADCDGSCPLSLLDGGHAACRLARRLAPAPHLVSANDPSAASSADRAARRYVQALRVAATAVFHCRHSHAAGECWFSPQGDRLCGEVLAVAHRLGA